MFINSFPAFLKGSDRDGGCWRRGSISRSRKGRDTGVQIARVYLIKKEDIDVFKHLVVLMLTFCSCIDFLKRLHFFLPSVSSHDLQCAAACSHLPYLLE